MPVCGDGTPNHKKLGSTTVSDSNTVTQTGQQ